MLRHPNPHPPLAPGRRLRRGAARALTGFTLVELLLAAVLGSILLTALSSSARMFSEHVEAVRADDGKDLQKALLLMTDAVRDAWCVCTPSDDRLEVIDASGGTTVFELVGDELRVTRPNGSTGVLAEGVSDMSLSTGTTRRLRDDDTVNVDGALFGSAAPLGPSMELVLREGDALALGFTMSGLAPDAVNTLEDVAEHRIAGFLEQFTTTFSFFNMDMKEFCHLHAAPPHNPEHPGYAGGRVRFELFEARAPEDARPFGSALASLDVELGDLPLTEWIWVDKNGQQEYPPDSIYGNPNAPACCGKDNHWHTEDGACDHPGHEKHTHPDDVPEGVAWGWWNNHEDVTLKVLPTTEPFSVDLSSLGAVIEPGKAYTMTMSVFGWDELRIPVYPTLQPDNTGVALRSGAGADFVEQPMQVAMSLSGNQTCTQTVAHDVVDRVTVSLTSSAGDSASGSAVVIGQKAVTDEWLGGVPGEVPELEM